jgi:hypothetical protein
VLGDNDFAKKKTPKTTPSGVKYTDVYPRRASIVESFMKLHGENVEFYLSTIDKEFVEFKGRMDWIRLVKEADGKIEGLQKIYENIDDLIKESQRLLELSLEMRKKGTVGAFGDIPVVRARFRKWRHLGPIESFLREHGTRNIPNLFADYIRGLGKWDYRVLRETLEKDMKGTLRVGRKLSKPNRARRWFGRGKYVRRAVRGTVGKVTSRLLSMSGGVDWNSESMEFLKASMANYFELEGAEGIRKVEELLKKAHNNFDGPLYDILVRITESKTKEAYLRGY